MSEQELPVEELARAARAASRVMATAATDQKNAVLRCLKEKLEARRAEIIEANEADMRAAAENSVAANLVKRLSFNSAKIDSRIRSLEKIAALPDPVGSVISSRQCENGMAAARVRVPLGVIFMVYEARPHVTVNAGSFCLKSGNACILRGGSEARRCNTVLGRLWRESLEAAGLPEDAVQVIAGSHEEVEALLQEDELIDLVIPRGGEKLIHSVTEKSKIPVLKHFAGVCHVYIDADADPAAAIEIALDSKCLMPAVCNAMETVVVHAGFAPHLPALVEAFRSQGVEVRGCEGVRKAVPDVIPAMEEDWTAEYLDLIVSIRMVPDTAAAIDHINTYGSHHTDTIVTRAGAAAAEQFTSEVDSGVVLVNASTMFCDGESLGMGAEIGISTDKIHARGPMGLEELTSYKFVIQGNGHTMGDYSEAHKEEAAS
jgi:glutamate-5-semialdehyde dehydrogenase